MEFADDEEIKRKILTYKQQAGRMKKKRKYVELKEPEFRYCLHCKAFKPERAHHCRECKRCSLMMDHHCPWAGNCVGVNNRKDFIHFLFYATLSMFMAQGLMVAKVVYWVQNARVMGPPQPLEIILMTLDFVFLLPVSLAVASLLFYQMGCVLSNLTTIDEYVMERQQEAASRKRIGYRWVYDFGWSRNWVIFFGPSIWEWFVPGYPPRQDGIHHERAHESFTYDKNTNEQ